MRSTQTHQQPVSRPTILRRSITNRDIGKKAEKVLFSKVRLWVEFDENFVEFLRRLTEERGVTDTTRCKREIPSARGAKDIALQIWLPDTTTTCGGQ
jgi:hypothetical protein